MKKTLLILLTLLPFSVAAQEMNHSAMGHDMEGMDHSGMKESAGGVEFSKEISTYGRDAHGQPMLKYGEIPMHDNELFYTFRADRLEQRFQDGDDVTLWDTEAWIGYDYNKLYLQSEGEYNTDKGEYESAEVELLYSRNVSTFWDVQAGFRHDFINGEDDRNFAALGVQGLAPYWFEIDATSYVSDEGDISAIAEAEFDLMLTQRLILQPRFETELALQDVPEYNIGSGINSIELGARLRYEISRKFAPYIGVEWEQNLGSTKNMLEAAGEDTSKTAIVAGVKLWF